MEDYRIKGSPVIVDTLNSLKYAYTIQTGIELVGQVIQIGVKRKLPSLTQMIKIFINLKSLRFSLFLGTLTLIKKWILQNFKKHFKCHTKYHSFISGFLAGFVSLCFLTKAQRAVWALYLLSRSFDTILSSLQNRNILKRRSYYYVIVYAFMMLVVSYAAFYQDDCFPENFIKKFRFFQNLSIREASFMDTCNSIGRGKKE